MTAIKKSFGCVLANLRRSAVKNWSKEGVSVQDFQLFSVSSHVLFRSLWLFFNPRCWTPDFIMASASVACHGLPLRLYELPELAS
jgi:hypothetical protein